MTSTITRTEIQVYTRKGDAWKSIPAWRLEIDGVFIQNHRYKIALERIAANLIERGEIDWYRAKESELV